MGLYLSIQQGPAAGGSAWKRVKVIDMQDHSHNFWNAARFLPPSSASDTLIYIENKEQFSKNTSIWPANFLVSRDSLRTQEFHTRLDSSSSPHLSNSAFERIIFKANMLRKLWRVRKRAIENPLTWTSLTERTIQLQTLKQFQNPLHP